MTHSILTNGFLNEAEVILHRMRSFHRGRVDAIQKNESHVRLSDSYRLILHVIPQEAVLESKSFAPLDLKTASQSFPRFDDGSGYGHRIARYNADGFLYCDSQDSAQRYAQFYRNGILEGVMARAAFKVPPKEAVFYREDACEETVIKAMAGYLSFAKTLKLTPPILMFAALSGCEGVRLCTDRSFYDVSEYAIDRNLIMLPEARVESLDIDAAKHLRPLCDALWNAVGFEKSVNFDEQGGWKRRQ